MKEDETSRQRNKGKGPSMGAILGMAWMGSGMHSLGMPAPNDKPLGERNTTRSRPLTKAKRGKGNGTATTKQRKDRKKERQRKRKSRKK